MNKTKYYRLNFNGFYDTRKNLFGNNLLQETNFKFDLNLVETLLDLCITNIKNKLNIIINRGSIVEIQFINLSDYAAATFPVERKEYMLLINQDKLNSKDELISAIYHELGHIYQLDRLFNEGIMLYDSFNHNLAAKDDATAAILRQHLNTNGGHTEYWQDFADKVNNIIKPAIKITAYVDESNTHVIMSEGLTEETYFNLDFNGFYDTFEDIFGKK